MYSLSYNMISEKGTRKWTPCTTVFIVTLVTCKRGTALAETNEAPMDSCSKLQQIFADQCIKQSSMFTLSGK